MITINIVALVDVLMSPWYRNSFMEKEHVKAPDGVWQQLAHDVHAAITSARVSPKVQAELFRHVCRGNLYGRALEQTTDKGITDTLRAAESEAEKNLTFEEAKVFWGVISEMRRRFVPVLREIRKNSPAPNSEEALKAVSFGYLSVQGIRLSIAA